ncbi:MAG: hypothetical protein J2P58_01880 [Acidimicrobiaceae bacterium]|nr:hypothetical protein [Acidimicrobiaceae bacterium]MBO0746961.1 hypothetical protein [Acidimicrobiaceae bacterium]
MKRRIGRLIHWLLRQGMRQGWRRGVLGDSRAFLVIGAMALLAHLFGRAVARDVEVVFSEPLRPGEAFRVFHEPRP